MLVVVRCCQHSDRRREVTLPLKTATGGEGGGKIELTFESLREDRGS